MSERVRDREGEKTKKGREMCVCREMMNNHTSTHVCESASRKSIGALSHFNSQQLVSN